MSNSPPPPSQVPEYYKKGLHAQELFNGYRAGRTQKQVHARAQSVDFANLPFRPYTDSEFAVSKAQLQVDVGALFADDRMVRARASAVLRGWCCTLTLGDSPISALASTTAKRLTTKSLAGPA